MAYPYHADREQLRCPFCGHGNTRVQDSRPIEHGEAIRRRRGCMKCRKRFKTYETVGVRYLHHFVVRPVYAQYYIPLREKHQGRKGWITVRSTATLQVADRLSESSAPSE